LAIVVSIACMMVASITQPVIITRLGAASAISAP